MACREAEAVTLVQMTVCLRGERRLGGGACGSCSRQLSAVGAHQSLGVEYISLPPIARETKATVRRSRKKKTKNFHDEAGKGRADERVVGSLGVCARSGSYQILFFLSDHQIKNSLTPHIALARRRQCKLFRTPPSKNGSLGYSVGIGALICYIIVFYGFFRCANLSAFLICDCIFPRLARLRPAKHAI